MNVYSGPQTRRRFKWCIVWWFVQKTALIGYINSLRLMMIGQICEKALVTEENCKVTQLLQLQHFDFLREPSYKTHFVINLNYPVTWSCMMNQWDCSLSSWALSFLPVSFNFSVCYSLLISGIEACSLFLHTNTLQPLQKDFSNSSFPHTRVCSAVANLDFCAGAPCLSCMCVCFGPVYDLSQGSMHNQTRKEWKKIENGRRREGLAFWSEDIHLVQSEDLPPIPPTRLPSTSNRSVE